MPPTPDTRPQVKGWCPGAHAPMPSNDGLLMRAKLIGSRLAASQLAAVAAIAADCGNGLVDLSQRAQLQLRGVTPERLPEALRRLNAAGLLAPDADAERVTNIVVSPLAGLDPSAAVDANALAHDLAQALVLDAALRALPAKFLFAIDDGGALSIADVEADIRLEATPTGIALRIAGDDGRAVAVTPDDALPVALRLARAFVALRAGDFELRRMGRLVAALGADAVYARAQVSAAPVERDSQPAPAPFGAQTVGGVCFAGVAAPSGRWNASELGALAAAAETHGSGDLRLTPWRGFLIPTPTPDAAREIVSVAEGLGLIASTQDPRLAVVACPGQPECPQAQGETRAHLARLAPLAQKLAGGNGVGLHLSGCAKGCARPGRTAVTLVARGDCFDLVENGAAGDAPSLEGLTLEAVEDALARAEKNPCRI
jgi:precorrin-3B synthase